MNEVNNEIGEGNSEAMKFLRIREAGERQIILDVAKSHKKPILYSLIVDVNEWKFHQCGNCVYNTDCHLMCKVLEASYPIRKFTEERFGVNLHELSLVPIHLTKRNINMRHEYE